MTGVQWRFKSAFILIFVDADGRNVFDNWTLL